jgi:hypothetical protein
LIGAVLTGCGDEWGKCESARGEERTSSLEIISDGSCGGTIMKILTLTAALYLGTASLAVAQTSAGSSAGSTGVGGAAGSTLSNGSTISGTGGSPGPNTSSALNHGTTGNNLGAPQAGAGGTAPASHGNAVDTPAAKAAIQNLGNTDAGVLKK